MEGVKRTASNNWSLVFQIALKSAGGSWQFCLEKFWPFSAFVMLQIRFCNHRVIKSSMIYLYIKPEVKKWYNSKDAAINEACIWWSHENCYLVRKLFLVWEMIFFFFWLLDGPNLPGFPQTVGLGEVVVQSIPGGDNKQDEGRANILGKMGKTDLILKPLIQLRNLIPVNIFQ